MAAFFIYGLHFNTHLEQEESMPWNIDETLAKLIHPVTPEEFYETYFGQRTLYVRGASGKFDEFYTEEMWRTQPLGETTAVYQTTHNGTLASRAIPIPPSQVTNFYDAGLLTVGRIDHHPQIARLIDGLRASLQFPPGKVSNTDKVLCFASKDGTGYRLHWDVHHNFILQIAGAKKWHFASTPAVDMPLDGPRIAEAGEPAAEYDGQVIVTPSLDELDQIVLRPGDFLYMPPGVWHAPIAQGHSNHITVALGHRPIYKLISDVLKIEIGRSRTLRRGFPTLRGQDRHTGVVPREIQALFEECLQEIRERLKTLDVRELYKEWSLEVAEHHFRAPASARNVEVQRNDRLTRPTPVPLRYCLGRDDDDPREDAIFIYAGDESYVSLPESARTFVEQLAAHDEFVAEAALSWDPDYDWDQVRTALSLLVRQGILRLVPAHDAHPESHVRHSL